MIEKIAEDLINKMPAEEKISLMQRGLSLAKRTAGATYRGAKAGAGLAWEGAKIPVRFAINHPRLTAAGLAGAGLLGGLYHIDKGARGAYNDEMANQLEDVMSHVDSARETLMNDSSKPLIGPKQYGRMKKIFDSGALDTTLSDGTVRHYGKELWHTNLKDLDSIIANMPTDVPMKNEVADYYTNADQLYQARNARVNEIVDRYQNILTGKPAMERIQGAASKAKGDFLKQTFLRRAAAPIVNAIPKVESAVGAGVNAVKGTYEGAKALLDLYEHGKGMQYKIPKPKLF